MADRGFQQEAPHQRPLASNVRATVPASTPLVRRARARGKQVITGAAVITLQALEQFVLYTGVRSSDDQVRRTWEFARA